MIGMFWFNCFPDSIGQKSGPAFRMDRLSEGRIRGSMDQRTPFPSDCKKSEKIRKADGKVVQPTLTPGMIFLKHLRRLRLWRTVFFHPLPENL